MKIYSIIVTYNGAKWINKCINSLLESSLESNIVVIDNCSTDNTLDLLSEYNGIKIIQSKENLGFGQANNIGLKIALKEKADFVFLLNQDAWVEQHTLQSLTNCFNQKNNEFGILSPIHLNGEGTMIDYNFFQYSTDKFDEGRKFYSDILLNNTKSSPYKINFINAACWLIPLECLEKVGGFNPIFPHYGEDEDYINRVHKKGYKVGLVPTSNIFHDRETRCETIKIEGFKEIKIYILSSIMKSINPRKLIFREFLYRASNFVKSLFFVDFKSTLINLKLISFLLGNSFKIISNYKERNNKGAFLN